MPVAEHDEAVLQGGQQRGGPAPLPAQRVLQRALRGEGLHGQPDARGRSCAGRAVHGEATAELTDPALQSTQAEVAGALGLHAGAQLEPAAVVGDAHEDRAVAVADLQAHTGRPRVARGVGQQLARDVADERVVDARGGRVDVHLQLEAPAARGVVADALQRLLERQALEDVLVHRGGQGAERLVGLLEIGVQGVERGGVALADAGELLPGSEHELEALVVQAVGQAGALGALGFGDLRHQARPRAGRLGHRDGAYRGRGEAFVLVTGSWVRRRRRRPCAVLTERCG